MAGLPRKYAKTPVCPIDMFDHIAGVEHNIDFTISQILLSMYSCRLKSHGSILMLKTKRVVCMAVSTGLHGPPTLLDSITFQPTFMFGINQLSVDVSSQDNTWSQRWCMIWLVLLRSKRYGLMLPAKWLTMFQPSKASVPTTVP